MIQFLVAGALTGLYYAMEVLVGWRVSIYELIAAVAVATGVLIFASFGLWGDRTLDYI